MRYPLEPKTPSPLQALALYVFRGMRDDLRGLIGLVAIASALILIPISPLGSILCMLFGVSLLIVNYRHRRNR